MPKTFEKIGLQIPQVWLPRSGIDLQRWAVVACDQYTAQPEYWREVEEYVGEAPSTLRLVFPEAYLESSGTEDRIRAIKSSMKEYLAEGLLAPQDGLVYVERTVEGRTRQGLVACLDLECYDYHPGAQSLVRASEGTILERLPPRMRIREGALLELPHILVLIDDPDQTVIEPLAESRSRLKPLYDFNLMKNGGHLAGWLVSDPMAEDGVIQALHRLASPEFFQEKYSLGSDARPLLFTVGDGNHSLAAAKAIWEKIKPAVPADHPTRFTLVEIVNLHSPALEFKPIHRILFGLQEPLLEAFYAYFGSHFSCESFSGPHAWEKMAAAMERGEQAERGIQVFGLVMPGECGVAWVANPSTNLAVGTLQGFLDQFMQRGGAAKIDYVHGEEVLRRLSTQPGNVGFFLPGMRKSDLFKTVILDGVLTRKTFSMGEAHEKRFYMECRRIAERSL